mmetsp:Transcript_69533/g.203484  ORF Transcript_69533/g.203484 Transcript_69533/m.203484 type:complete len:236 (+) Transcript_69533:110-817(+)
MPVCSIADLGDEGLQCSPTLISGALDCQRATGHGVCNREVLRELDAVATLPESTEADLPESRLRHQQVEAAVGALLGREGGLQDGVDDGPGPAPDLEQQEGHAALRAVHQHPLVGAHGHAAAPLVLGHALALLAEGRPRRAPAQRQAEDLARLAVFRAQSLPIVVEVELDQHAHREALPLGYAVLAVHEDAAAVLGDVWVLDGALGVNPSVLTLPFDDAAEDGVRGQADTRGHGK